MARARSAGLGLATLTLAASCSLHSLDYLSADDGGEGEGGDGSGATGGQGASSSGGAATPNGGVGAQSGASPQAGSGANGGSGATSGTGGSGASGGSDGTPEAGAGGAPEIEVPDCQDEQQTVDETDIDCGGRTCAPCPADKECVTGTDCQSGICTNQVCQTPTCTDIAVNGDETDMNCGGKCTPCAQGQHCNVNADCSTKKCTENMCVSTVCQEGVLQDGCPLLIDNTPYSLSPAHALARCMDDDAESVAEGNRMVLYSCKAALNQTFWAVARADGYFAFRSALSAKCLQVRGKSTAENAIVEQSTCSYASEQLWKPTRVDDSLMQLTNKLSSLALDVAGSSVDANGQNITQGKAGATDTRWRLQRRSTGGYAALSASDDSSHRMRHDDSAVTLTSDDTPSAQWKLVPGLNDARYVSFQSRDDPGRYLRHASYRIWADTNDDSSQFKKDATFQLSNPLTGVAPNTKALQSTNFPGNFMSRDGSRISLAPSEDNAGYKAGATWIVSPR